MNRALPFLVSAVLISLPALAGEPPAGNATAGKAVFVQNCLICHGAEGRGDGPASAALNPRPANFADPGRAAVMTEAKQQHVVKEGGPAEKLSPFMPAFGENLSDKQIRDVVTYVRESLSKVAVSQK